MLIHTPLAERIPRIIAGCPLAQRAGVRPGHTLAEAQSLVPRGLCVTADPESDRQQLRELAWECQRFTPRVGLEPTEVPESLWLDVTGCAPHFGSLRGLCRKLFQFFRQRGYRLRLGVAPTFAAAWALTHTQGPWQVTASQLRDLLARVPITGLRLEPQTLTLLEECGLSTIGQLLAISRDNLACRFGAQLPLRLAQLLGDREEALPLELPPVPLEVVRQSEEPLPTLEIIEAVLQEMLGAVCVLLRRERLWTQHLQITAQPEQGSPTAFELRWLVPTQQSAAVQELLGLQLARGVCPIGLTRLQMVAIPCRATLPPRLTLFGEATPAESEFQRLVERLSSRLGEEAVLRAHCLPEAQPELAWRFIPWLSETVTATATTRDQPDRPCRLFTPPQRVQLECDPVTSRPQRLWWQREELQITLSEGPERIVTGWWRPQRAQRDYYRVETDTGQRLWVFQDLVRRNWFVQGTYE